MSEETIGHGTWYDMMAKKVIEREQTLNRDMSKIRTEMGLGASGFPHIGSLRRCISKLRGYLGT